MCGSWYSLYLSVSIHCVVLNWLTFPTFYSVFYLMIFLIQWLILLVFRDAVHCDIQWGGGLHHLFRPQSLPVVILHSDVQWWAVFWSICSCDAVIYSIVALENSLHFLLCTYSSVTSAIQTYFNGSIDVVFDQWLLWREGNGSILIFWWYIPFCLHSIVMTDIEVRAEMFWHSFILLSGW